MNTVLVVEDDRILRTLLQDELSISLGCRVMAAEGLRRAIEVLSMNRIDLVLSDVKMPDGTGLELLSWVRNSAQNKPPVILMTGFSGSNAAEIEKQGAAAVVTKPFDWEKVTGLISRVLAGATESTATRTP
jgi:DNA-binding NtrC family response regulator